MDALDILILQILSIEQLELKVQETEAYDGYSHEDMLETFIERNGYNPVQSLKDLKFCLLDDLICEASTNEFIDEFLKIIRAIKDSKRGVLDNLDEVKAFEEFTIKNFNHFPKQTLLPVVNYIIDLVIKSNNKDKI